MNKLLIPKIVRWKVALDIDQSVNARKAELAGPDFLYFSVI